MKLVITSIFIVASFISRVTAVCPNQCSLHGSCGPNGKSLFLIDSFFTIFSFITFLQINEFINK
jgi:hypothetical protein